MLSVVVEQPNQMAVRERPQPQPGAGEVRVRVRYAGICGSDVHILHGKNPFVVYPRVIGHEFVGRIDAVGEGVDARASASWLSVDPVVSCGRCHACLAGRRNVCRNLQVIGVHRDGGFSEYMTAPAATRTRFPPACRETSSAIIEPFAVAAQVTSRTGVFRERHCADLRRRPGRPQHPASRSKACYGIRAFITDQIDERLELALQCGAGPDDIINTARDRWPKALAKRGVDGGPTVDLRRRGPPEHPRGSGAHRGAGGRGSVCSASRRTRRRSRSRSSRRRS